MYSGFNIAVAPSAKVETYSDGAIDLLHRNYKLVR